jgi:predicted kinase
MQKIIFTRGIPGAGKSHWSKAFVEKNPSYIRVCRDDLRNMRGRYWLPRQEELISRFETHSILSALEMGYNVVVDATNLNPNWVANIKFHIGREFINQEFIYEYKDFTDVSLEDCIKNDLKRPNSVGEKVIREFYNKYLRPKYEVIQNPERPHVVICDLDGTLALHTNRTPHQEDRCDEDNVNPVVQNILIDYLRYPLGRHILFVSGRQDNVYQKTYDWIVNKAGFNNFDLFMRKTNDNRNDAIVKREIFMDKINGHYFVDFILDDRNRVIDMWRNDLKLTVLQVADGDF